MKSGDPVTSTGSIPASRFASINSTARGNKMADENALAIFLAERKQPVARDALERLEQHRVQQPPVALLRDVQARDSRGESEQV